MFLRKLLDACIPKGFLWKLTLVNSVVIALSMGLTGWAIYETACQLVGEMGSTSSKGHLHFNATLFQYFILFTLLGILISSAMHFYLTKKIIAPVRELIQSTKILKTGVYPEPLTPQGSGEIAEPVLQYNELIKRLKNKDEERQKLLEDISHELRTPTSNIKGYLYALKEGDITGDRELFQSLHDQAEQLTGLIEQIDYVQTWAVKEVSYDDREWIDSRSLVEDCLRLFAWRLQEEKVPVDLRVEEVPLYVHINGLHQVLSNIIDNALRYRVGSEGIKITGKKEAARYIFSIQGEGEPIPAEEQARVFDRFYRVEQSRNRDTGGSGLGLAIAKEIVFAHQGELSLQSDGHLHNFLITLPLETKSE